MAKFHGAIGFSNTEEVSPGVWIESDISEVNYYGDILRNNYRMQQASQVNDELNVAIQISIIADPFANNNFPSMKYVKYLGTRWKITNVDVLPPRLILTLGGVYNGQ